MSKNLWHIYSAQGDESQFFQNINHELEDIDKECLQMGAIQKYQSFSNVSDSLFSFGFILRLFTC